MAPWWLRQLAVFGSLSPSTASGRVFFIRDIGEWNSITAPATLDHLLGHGHRAVPRDPDRRARVRADDLHDARSPGSCSRRSWSSAPGPDDGRSTSGRSSCTRRCCSRSRRSSRPSTSRAGRSSTPRSPSRRTPTSWRSRASRSPSAWIAARRRAWERGRRDHGLHRRDPRVRGRGRARSDRCSSTRSGRTSRAKFVAVADALDRAGAPPTDRVMSIDASGTKYWTGRGGVVLVNDPIETDRARRPRLRHPLARARPRGQRRRRRADPRRRSIARPGSGRAGPRRRPSPLVWPCSRWSRRRDPPRDGR